MKGPLNPPLNVGDRIILYHMEGETSVPLGAMGTVTKVQSDPFEENNSIINVDWDNGSKLSLLSGTDAWKKVLGKKLQEQNQTWNYMTQNSDIFENFDWRWLREFLYKIRESGIVNMFAASPLLYAGRDHIERYYGEGKEEDEAFQEVLDNADEARNKIVLGVIKYMEKNNKDLDNLGQVNNYARHFSQKIVGLYAALSSYNRYSDRI